MKPEIYAKNGQWAPGPPGADRRTPRDPRRAVDQPTPFVPAGGERKERPVASTRRASIRVVRRIDAPPERVFDAWLDPTIAGNWLFATASRPMARADIDARVAGAFGFAARDDDPVEYRGEYLEIVPRRRIAFTLVTKELPQVTARVVVEITALWNNGCSVALTHENVPPGFATRTRQRWTGILYGLEVTLASRTEETPCNTC